MAREEAVVVGVGMMTAVGLSAAETAASVRAGTMRFTSIAWLDRHFEPFTIAEVPADGLPDLADSLAAQTGLTDREARLLRLGTQPLLECRKPLAGSAKSSVPLILALPDTETMLPLDRAAFLEHLTAQAPRTFTVSGSDASPRGRAGGLIALGQAVARIEAGQAPWVLAGGIDTYRNLFVLGKLDKEQRVKTSRQRDGFIPGEAAAFLLLASRKAAQAAALRPRARITRATTGFEEGHLASDHPYRGDGLAACVTQYLQEADLPRPIQEVYSSLNGENHWAKEWGVALLRNRAAFADGHGFHHPADCFGDTGAACGVLLAGLAVLGLEQGYRRSPCLVYSSSDHGPRAVLAVTLP